MGVSMTSDGARVAVGAPGDDDKGSAFIFDVLTGHELNKLNASDGNEWDYFGSSVSISPDGTHLAVGAYYADDDSSAPDDDEYNSGAAYIFDLATGSELHKLRASDGGYEDLFGCSVSISSGGARVAVGAKEDDDGSEYDGSGSVYVFEMAEATSTTSGTTTASTAMGASITTVTTTTGSDGSGRQDVESSFGIATAALSAPVVLTAALGAILSAC